MVGVEIEDILAPREEDINREQRDLGIDDLIHNIQRILD